MAEATFTTIRNDDGGPSVCLGCVGPGPCGAVTGHLAFTVDHKVVLPNGWVEDGGGNDGVLCLEHAALVST